jgi:hypothetical protein
MPKSPIWLDPYEMEILAGYLARLLADNSLPNYAIAVLETAYKQAIKEEN